MGRLAELGTYLRTEAQAVLVGNDRVEIGIDRTHGCVIRLLNKVTGTEFIRVPGLSRAFRIIYPQASPGIRDLDLSAEFQASPRFSWIAGDGPGGLAEPIKGNTNRDIECPGRSTLVVQYDGLVSNPDAGAPQSFPVSVSFFVTVDPGTEDTIWEIEVENQGAVVVREVWFPYLGGIGKIGPHDRAVLPYQAGNIIEDPLHAFPDSAALGRWPAWTPVGPNLAGLKYRIHYPAPASMQWLDYGTSEEGLMLASLDPSLDLTGIQFEKMLSALHSSPVAPRAATPAGEEGLGMFFVKFPFLAPGRRWRSPPFLVSLHVGDWHRAADRYRAWAYRTWQLASIRRPAWVRSFNGLLMHTLRNQDRRTSDDYEDLPRIARIAKDLRLDALYTLGWWKEGMDAGFPRYEPWDDERLIAAIRRVHQEGLRVLLYANGRLFSLHDPDYPKVGASWAVKDAHGVEPREHWEWSTQYPSRLDHPWIDGETYCIPCPSVPEWRAHLREVAARVTRSYGADGIEIDQVGIAPALLCFDSGHPHPNPAAAFGPGVRKLLQELRSDATIASVARGRSAESEASQEFILLEEGVVDAHTPFVDLHYQMRGALPPAKDFPELFRYTFPEVRLLLAAGINEFEILYRTFALGMGFEVHYGSTHGAPYREYSRFPRHCATLRRLGDLRRRWGRYLLEGRFRDTCGIWCSEPRIEVKGFVADRTMFPVAASEDPGDPRRAAGEAGASPSGFALVLWNHSSRDLAAVIRVDIGRLFEQVEQTAGLGREERPAGDWQVSDGETGEFLPARAVERPEVHASQPARVWEIGPVSVPATDIRLLICELVTPHLLGDG